MSCVVVVAGAGGVVAGAGVGGLLPPPPPAVLLANRAAVAMASLHDYTLSHCAETLPFSDTLQSPAPASVSPATVLILQESSMSKQQQKQQH